VRLFESLCTPSFHYEDPLTMEPLSGLRALADTPSACGMRFPNVAPRALGERMASASFAAAPVRVRGTHLHPLDSLPATGKELDFQLVFVCELEDGLLRRVRASSTSTTSGCNSACCPPAGRCRPRRCWLCAATAIGRSPDCPGWSATPDPDCPGWSGDARP
jgi:hypothetical protein